MGFNNIFDKLTNIWSQKPPIVPGKNISAAEVRKLLVAEIGPVLESIGFGRFDRNRAWKHCEKWVDVVEIQFIRTYTTTANSPSVHVGRYFYFVPDDNLTGPVKIKNGVCWPTVEYCHFRKTIYKSIKQSQTKEPNIWFIGQYGEYLDECIQDALYLTKTQIIPWFNWLDDLRVVLNLLLTGDADMEGKAKDPVKRGSWNYTNYFSRHVVAGLVAVELKQWTLATECLAPVLEHGGVVGRNGQIFPLPQQSIERIQAAYDLSIRG